MDSNATIDDLKVQLIEQLLLLSKSKTFLTTEDILNKVIAANLPVDELDRVCESLLDKGVLICQDPSEIDYDINLDDVFNDRSQIDYEIIFNRVIQIDNSLKDYISDLRQIPSPKTNEEKRLIVRAREGNGYATNRIITMFLKVVVRIALWYYDNYSLPLMDTIQDGNVGLLMP